MTYTSTITESGYPRAATIKRAPTATATPRPPQALPVAGVKSSSIGLKQLMGRIPGGQAILDAAGRTGASRWARHLKEPALIAYGVDAVFSAGKALEAAKTAYHQADNPIQGIGKGLLEAGKVFGKSMAAVTGGLVGMSLAGAGLAAVGVTSGLAGLAVGVAAFAAGHWLVEQLVHNKEKTPSETLRDTVSGLVNPFAKGGTNA